MITLDPISITTASRHDLGESRGVTRALLSDHQQEMRRWTYKAQTFAAIAQTDEIGSNHSSGETSNVPKITDNAQPGVEPTDGRIYGQMTLPQPEATVGQAKQLVNCLSTAAREASSGLAGSIRQDPYSAALIGRASLGSFFSGGPGRMSRPGLSRARRTALNRLGVQSWVAS